MSKQLIIHILVLMLLLPGIIVHADIEEHHDSGSDLHHVAHNLGQAHSHDDYNPDEINLEFSREAIDHVSDPLDKLSSEYVLLFSKELPQSKIVTNAEYFPLELLEPFIRHIQRPPKV